MTIVLSGTRVDLIAVKGTGVSWQWLFRKEFDLWAGEMGCDCLVRAFREQSTGKEPTESAQWAFFIRVSVIFVRLNADDRPNFG